MQQNSIDKWLKWMQFGKRLGCHQIAERSFFFKGYQFPVCARCTGVIVSSFIAAIAFFVYKISIYVAIGMSGIMFLDWFIQYLEIRQSTNTRRLITGIIGGYGFMTVQMYIYWKLIQGIIWLIYRIMELS